MSKKQGIPAKWTLAILVSLPVLFLFLLPLPGFLAGIEALSRVFAGFYPFLHRNLPQISSDAGTWGPGLAAFLSALVVIHGFGRAWARRRQRSWKVSATLSLGMMLPLLFAISFLVPGMLLQAERLGRTSWFVREFGEASYFRQQLMMIGLQLIEATAEGERYPDSLEVLVNRNRLKPDELLPRGGSVHLPREPVIYLGRGLTATSDPSLPLLISPRYSEDGASHRMVLTTGHQIVVIRDRDLDNWIDKAIAAKR